MATLPITVDTPCGPITIKVPIPGVPFPDINLIINFKLPIPKFPLPDCSLLKHTGAAPDPPEDSEP